jgi:hypothetical protein
MRVAIIITDELCSRSIGAGTADQTMDLVGHYHMARMEAHRSFGRRGAFLRFRGDACIAVMA